MEEVNFKQLQKIWYKKLRDSGFKDIEKPGGYINNSFITNRRAIPNKQLNSHYYVLASSFFNDFNWELLPPKLQKRELYSQIWDLHRNGMSFQNIGKELNISTTNTFDRYKYIKIQYFVPYLKELHDKK